MRRRKKKKKQRGALMLNNCKNSITLLQWENFASKLILTFQEKKTSSKLRMKGALSNR
jgi:hypothetical protein